MSPLTKFMRPSPTLTPFCRTYSCQTKPFVSWMHWCAVGTYLMASFVHMCTFFRVPSSHLYKFLFSNLLKIYLRTACTWYSFDLLYARASQYILRSCLVLIFFVRNFLSSWVNARKIMRGGEADRVQQCRFQDSNYWYEKNSLQLYMHKMGLFRNCFRFQPTRTYVTNLSGEHMMNNTFTVHPFIRLHDVRHQ